MKPTRASVPAPAPSPDAKPARPPAFWRSPAILPAIFLILTGALVAADSVTGLAIGLLEGWLAIGVLAAAGLAGMWLVPVLGLGQESWRDRLMLGAGLGIGALSLLTLALGAAGWLDPGAKLLVAVLILAALLRVGLDVHKSLRTPAAPQEPAGDPSAAATHGKAGEGTRRQALALSGFHYLWLLTAPFLALTILAATLPPGILWQEEAWGYDVLEYHLAVPKEFHEADRIFFMPYNVYSNFPLNSEMLSLLMMSLRGDAIEATFTAQLVNVGLALLFVAGAWWAGRFYSPRAGIVAGVLAGTTPWISYLAGIAYVEPGMLAMGMLSLGAMLRALRQGPNAFRWVLAAGLLAGLACGYKYTAVPLIAAPIALLLLFVQAPWAVRLKQIGLFGVAALLTFSPWMIRNLVNTANPVFPLAWSVFGAKDGVWDTELEARWQRGHGWTGAGLEEGLSILMTALDRTVLDTRLGLILAFLAVAGAILRRDRLTLAFLTILALQIVVWFTATHLFARFAAVMVIPLIPLAARIGQEYRKRKLATVALAVALVMGAGWNLYQFTGLYYIHTRLASPGKTVDAHGHVNWFVKGEWPGYDYLKIVNELGPNARVMFVGEARTFYVRPPRDYAVVFSHHPLAVAAEIFVGDPQTDGSTETSPEPQGYRAIVEWLADRGVTHVLVHWLEMDRLRRTYGFSPYLTPELFDNLEAAGLDRVGGGDFMLDDNGMPYATLYEVPHE